MHKVWHQHYIDNIFYSASKSPIPYILELYIPQIAKFGDGIMGNFSRDEQLHQTHLFRTYMRKEKLMTRMHTLCIYSRNRLG